VSDAASGTPFGASSPLGTIVTRPRPDVVALEVDGEVDTLTAPRLESCLDEVLDTATTSGSAVVADLTGVTFLSSSGLAVLIRGARRATAAGVALRLVAATRAVTRPLTVTGADVLFDIHSDVASALTARTAAADVAPPPGGGGR